MASALVLRHWAQRLAAAESFLARINGGAQARVGLGSLPALEPNHRQNSHIELISSHPPIILVQYTRKFTPLTGYLRDLPAALGCALGPKLSQRWSAIGSKWSSKIQRTGSGHQDLHWSATARPTAKSAPIALALSRGSS